MENFTPKKKNNRLFIVSLFTILFFCLSATIFGQGIDTGVTFNWADTQSSVSDPATLSSISINGNEYNTFVVPSNYELTRLGPGGNSENNIWSDGSRIVTGSDASNWPTEALKAYQSINLNHYFQSQGNGDNFCNNQSASTTTDAQIQTISYNPGIPSNPDGILAITERGGNNCLYVELHGIPVGGGPEQLLGTTFVRNEGNLTGIQPQSPPGTNADYWSSGRNNENNQIIGIALFELSSIAPTGSLITSIKYYGATLDHGDGKFFLMQTYAVDDIFEPDFETTFNGNVATNDNVPNGSTYSLQSTIAPFNGSIAVNTDGTFSYTPNSGFTGTDTFEVEVCLPAPNSKVCNISTVTLNIKPGVSIDDASAIEGNNLNFTISTNAPFNTDIDFNIVYTNNSTSSSDYSGPSTVTLLANTNNVVFSVAANDDILTETDETFTITFSDTNGSITPLDNLGIGTIIDNDYSPITSSDYDKETTITCGDETPEVPALEFMGGCGDFTVVFNEEEQFSTGTDDYMIVRTWNVTDACDNTAIFEQIIFVMQPEKELITIDICIEDPEIDLLNYLPTNFDTNGTFEITSGNGTLNGSYFNPIDFEIGEYLISYTATDTSCKFFADFTININADCLPCNVEDIIVSKAVTVNGDGKNDFFTITGVESCGFEYHVMLFNRWGDKVYESEKYENDWGGTSPNSSFGNSGVLPAGTYYYIINITNKELKPLNGYIYLGTE